MKRSTTPLILALFLILTLAACGSTTEVGTGSPDDDEGGEIVEENIEQPTDDEPIPVEPDGGIGDGAEPLPMTEEQVITNTVMVDPQLTTPSELMLNPDNPAELWVRFIGSDPNCTAAEVILLTETPDAVEVELHVGITEDALARSCMAGEFELRVELPLAEDATGKSLSAAQAGTAEAPMVTPDLSTDDFIGLTEDEAAAIAAENIIEWRTVRVDDEFLIVTQDYSLARLNFEIDDGVITAVTLG